jgi:hypothetical protein
MTLRGQQKCAMVMPLLLVLAGLIMFSNANGAINYSLVYICIALFTFITQYYTCYEQVRASTNLILPEDFDDYALTNSVTERSGDHATEI